jgi:hypothetical protein
MGVVALLGGLGVVMVRPHTPPTPVVVEEEAPLCRAELWSWVVAAPHPGRHLCLNVDCGPDHGELSGWVEFSSASMRLDYDASSQHAPRVARMSRGTRLRPIVGTRADSERLEYTYDLTLEQARCVQSDRMWAAPYQLLGTNSTSGMRAVLEDCGCSLTATILAGGGAFGTFPGVDLELGETLPPEGWPEFGIPGGPTSPAQD